METVYQSIMLNSFCFHPAYKIVSADKPCSKLYGIVHFSSINHPVKTYPSFIKVTIPATVSCKGVTYKVTVIGKNAFKNHKKLEKVTIGTGIFISSASVTAAITPELLKTMHIIIKNAIKRLYLWFRLLQKR